MVSSIYCSLNFPTPPTTSPCPPISATPQLSCSLTLKDRSWRNRCVLGLTSAIIGLDGGDFAVVGDQERAMAIDMQSSAVAVGVPRWSDKRACLPWWINSLEMIVPENLPGCRRGDGGRPRASLRRLRLSGLRSNQARKVVSVCN